MKNNIKDKTFLFLGSSVTYGSSANGRSMADMLGEYYGCNIIKSAVSGTTLADTDGESYVSRLNALVKDRAHEKLDAFICQLSTNDAAHPDTLGAISDVNILDTTKFDTKTCFGAIEYIINVARKVWDCPIIFYTNSYFDSPVYEEMVRGIHAIANMYGIEVLDLYGDKRFNEISAEQKATFMTDDIHPTEKGYREWWLPEFYRVLNEL